MFMNFKRLLLTLYRLEEGQQEIMERLYALQRRGNPPGGGEDSSGALHPQNDSHCHPEEHGDEGSYANPADTWIIDGIEAILSYRRNPKEETK